MQCGAKSAVPLEDGLTSALLCLTAKESSESHRFEDLSWFNTKSVYKDGETVSS